MASQAGALPAPTRRAIDLAGYTRADILRAFIDRQMPQFSVTCAVDVTALKQACVHTGASVFLASSHAVSCSVNAVPPLRHRVIGGVLYEYDRTDPGYTVAREGDLFSFCNGVHLDDFGAYCREARARMNAVQHTPDLSVGEKHHQFFISSVPWLAFTGFTHPYDPLYAHVPVVTLGKLVETQGRWQMPVAIQVHHGTVDGVHVARFFDQLTERCAHASAWLNEGNAP